jgi:hypothetical protein
MRRAFPVAALLAMAVGCGAAATQVPVKGKDTEVVRLAGSWEGTYVGADSGRRGTIRFDLTLGRYTAEGQVLMFAQGAPEPQPLQIRFVSVEDNRISGTIAPYVDPQCDCTVQTEFLGNVEGDTIDGTFVSHLQGLDVTHRGSWAVYRNRQ